MMPLPLSYQAEQSRPHPAQRSHNRQSSWLRQNDVLQAFCSLRRGQSILQGEGGRPSGYKAQTRFCVLEKPGHRLLGETRTQAGLGTHYRDAGCAMPARRIFRPLRLLLPRRHDEVSTRRSTSRQAQALANPGDSLDQLQLVSRFLCQDSLGIEKGVQKDRQRYR